MKAITRRATTLAVAAILMTAPALTPATAASSVPVPGAVSIAAAVSKAKITTQPKSATVASGKTHTFSVKASGSKLKYQWYAKKPKSSKWVKASGDSAKTKSLKVKASTKLNGMQYRVVASNSRAKSTSKSAKLTVVTKPKIATQPKGHTVVAKSKVTLSSKASGGSISYQWQSKKGSTWSNISKATKSTHTFTASSGASTTDFRVVASNKAGKAMSTTARLVVIAKPKVTIPGSVIANAGRSVTFKGTATGGSLSYQWERWVEGTTSGYWAKIPGATQVNYTFTARSKNEMESYRLVASNKAGKTASNDSTLYVDSTRQDPMALDQLFTLSTWLLLLDSPHQQVSDTEAGMVDLYADMTVGNISNEVLVPGAWLTVDYIGNDGFTYNGDEYYVEDSYLNIGALDPTTNDFTDAIGYGVVFSDVPADAVPGGVWRITDSEFGEVQYVRGF
ncbi:hypothetical protein ACSYDW_05085 [Paeniglutamicibacter sp. R2-26]|uniref:hypothetical protein n=1 Tax=Paeniglutamicibacter sp. R2-26 TaxID=3144417 RepID=UPI003EE6F343